MKTKREIADNFAISSFCVWSGVWLLAVLHYIKASSAPSFYLPIIIAGFGFLGMCLVFYQAYRRITDLEKEIEFAGRSYFRLNSEAEILETENHFLKARMGSFERQLEEYENMMDSSDTPIPHRDVIDLEESMIVNQTDKHESVIPFIVTDGIRHTLH